LVARVAGRSIIVTRNRRGELRAFHNVCRHRAGPLLWDGAGECSSSSLVCRYHGWAYGLDGSLLSARDFGAAVEESKLGLVPVQVDVWRGLVFVNLWADGPPLLASLGSFTDECDGFPMESLTFWGDVSHDIEANWKTYADNYGEGYHIPLVHPELNRQVEAKRYAVDVRDDGRYAVHSAPSRSGAVTSGRWLWRFPNLALNLYPGGMNVERFVPLGPRRVRIEYSYFFADVSSPGSVAANEEAIGLSRELLEEDRLICEAVQRNLESGAYDTGVLSPRHENGVAYFQRLVRDALT
ncbi:MAG: aromatic ring-hydroxylating oxygenase subunit alpha, partial [Actinomycetota bacterium]